MMRSARTWPTVLSVWLVITLIGLTGVELWTRRRQGYLLWSWTLERRSFTQTDRLRVYNRRFYEEDPGRFREWPIRLELFDSDRPHPLYLYKPNLRMMGNYRWFAPAHPGSPTPQLKVDFSTNSLGFRGPEFSVHKPAGTIRIVCLGGSTTEGGLGQEGSSYPYFLQQELNRLVPHHPIEVINAGHAGYRTIDSLELLRQRVLPLAPDVVLFYEGNNNVNFNQFVSDLPPGISYNLGVPDMSLWLQATPWWYRWPMRYSAVFVLLSERMGWDRGPLPPMTHHLELSTPPPCATEYRDLLRQMARASLDRGSLMVLSSFISIFHEGFTVTYKDSPLIFSELKKKWYPLTPGELGQIYEVFNQQAAEVAREFGVPFVDATTGFPRELRYFDDSIHLNPKGYHLLATRLATALAKEVFPTLLKNHRQESLAENVVSH